MSVYKVMEIAKSIYHLICFGAFLAFVFFNISSVNHLERTLSSVSINENEKSSFYFVVLEIHSLSAKLLTSYVVYPVLIHSA